MKPLDFNKKHVIIKSIKSMGNHEINPPTDFWWVFYIGDYCMKRGMIFIDGSNVFFDWSLANHTKMDIEKYIELVQSKFPEVDFIRTYYFTSKTDNNTMFLQHVNKIPYCQVITGRLQEKTIKIEKRHNIKCGMCKTPVVGSITTQTDKGTDVNIAVEMLKHAYAKSYDTAVLISRDADFTGVVKIIKNLGCNVELVLFESAQANAQELSATVDNVTIIKANEYKVCEKI